MSSPGRARLPQLPDDSQGSFHFTWPPEVAEAIAKVERNADADWKAAALRAVVRVAVERAQFTSAHVVETMEELERNQVEGPTWTHDRRALGAVLVQAAQLKFCSPTEPPEHWMMKSGKRNATYLRVWNSHLYAPPPIEVR